MRETPRHASLVRLLEASRLPGPSALASALGESEQTVTNWGTRGVSKSGALKAANKFGCNANWILTGVGLQPQSGQTAPPTLAATLAALSVYLFALDAATRRLAGYLLADMAGNPQNHAQIAAVLEASVAPKAPNRTAQTDADDRLTAALDKTKPEPKAKPKRKEG